MIGNVVVVIPARGPSQLSVAVGAVKASTLHSAVISFNVVTSATGAVTSFIITF